MKFKEGDFVKIIDREILPIDTKNGTYYPFYRGLVGVVDRVYDDKEVCINVDTNSLPADVLKRHTEIQDAIKKKWLNNLSNEARNRLSAEDKQFTLAYTLLVQINDLEKAQPSDKPKPVAPKTPSVIESANTAETEDEVEEKPKPAMIAEAAAAPKKAKAKSEDAHSVTPNDLDAAEEAFLKERQEQMKSQ